MDFESYGVPQKTKKSPKTVKNKLQLRNVLEPTQTKEIKWQKIGNNSDNSDFQIVSKKLNSISSIYP